MLLIMLFVNILKVSSIPHIEEARRIVLIKDFQEKRGISGDQRRTRWAR